jgi:hypothetical protein
MPARAIAFPTLTARLDGYFAVPDGEGPHLRDMKIYPDARHSFFNAEGRAYNEPAATDAWQRTPAFFAEHVRPPRATA